VERGRGTQKGQKRIGWKGVMKAQSQELRSGMTERWRDLVQE
jgi:hypothetical protein